MALYESSDWLGGQPNTRAAARHTADPEGMAILTKDRVLPPISSPAASVISTEVSQLIDYVNN